MSRSTFTLWIGVFGAVLNFSMIIITLYFTAFFDTVFEKATDSKEFKEDVEDDKEILNGLTFYLFIEFVFNVFVSILMIYGVHKKRHTYIAPWVILNGLSLFMQLYYIFSELGNEEHYYLRNYVYGYCILSALIWFPIFSYYKSLKKEKTETVDVPAAPSVYVAAVGTFPTPSEFCHANAKYVAPSNPTNGQIKYPSIA